MTGSRMNNVDMEVVPPQPSLADLAPLPSWVEDTHTHVCACLATPATCVCQLV